MADSACVGSGNGPSGPLARLAAFLEQERPAGKHAPKFLLQGDAAAQDPAFLALMVTTTSPRPAGAPQGDGLSTGRVTVCRWRTVRS